MNALVCLQISGDQQRILTSFCLNYRYSGALCLIPARIEALPRQRHGKIDSDPEGII